MTKFVCVDGPDFDATLVDWDDLRARQAAYRSEEGESLKAYEGKELRMPLVNGRFVCRYEVAPHPR